MKSLLSRLGPGLLCAGAAVGVSHLVQSTRAGASYGFFMIIIVFVANLIKYPFFKAGPLFAAAEGKSLLEAFNKEGKWAMLLFYLITFSAVFTVQAVVTLLTASVFVSIFQLSYPLWVISAFLLLICSAVLLIGRYKLLDNIMKTVIILLTITTIITLISAFIFDEEYTSPVQTFSFFNSTDVFFLIALVGWMPVPLDIALWHSEWTLMEAKQAGESLDVKKSSFDFKVGYWGTTFLAMAFVGMGALILRGSGSELPSGGAAFAGEVIGMYTNTLGKWSFAFVAIAAFTTMFSTTLTIFDAYPRVINKAMGLSFKKRFSLGYTFWLVLVGVGALFALIFQLENMKQLVDFATTVSFLTAPVLATLIYRVSKKSTIKIFTTTDIFLAWVGLLFLYCFSAYFVWTKFIT